MSKGKAKDGTANKSGKTTWQKQIDKLKELAKPSQSISLALAISEPILYDWLNETLDTALKAAGLDVDHGYKNFAKLICIQFLSYPREDYFNDLPFQRKLTRDILDLVENKFNDCVFLAAIQCFDLLRNIIDPKNTGVLNLTDEKLKKFLKHY